MKMFRMTFNFFFERGMLPHIERYFSKVDL